MDNLTPEEIRTLKRLANDKNKARSGWKWIGARFGIPLALVGLAMILFALKNMGVRAHPLLPMLLPFGAILIFTGSFAALSRFLFKA